MIVAGIDAGSRAVKVVVMDADGGRVLAAGACDQGVAQSRTAGELFADLLRRKGLTRAEIRDVGQICNDKKIKITQCQLECFK